MADEYAVKKTTRACTKDRYYIQKLKTMLLGAIDSQVLNWEHNEIRSNVNNAFMRHMIVRF